MIARALAPLHLVPSIGPASYGLGSVVLNLVQNQKRHSLKPQIWCLDDLTELIWAKTVSGLQSMDIKSFHYIGLASLKFTPQMEKAAKQNTGQQFDVVHQHGIWTGVSRVTNAWRSANHKPVIIAPHGSLESWALHRSMWKKRLALLAYERQNLWNATCLHALTESEVFSFRNFGLHNPVAVIPNGISDEWLDSSGDGTTFRIKYNIPAKVRILLFLGRVTPKKGLPMLVRAMNTAREHLAGWQLIIAGGNEFSHQREVQSCIAQAGLENRVRFIGPIFGEDKRNAFAAADLFVLPSYSEGSPMVILEALGAGVSVLTTKASPWEELLTHRCGWWTDISEEAIADALAEAFQLPQEELGRMGQRGKNLAARRYTWSQSAQQSLLLYEWLLGRSDKPGFVFQD